MSLASEDDPLVFNDEAELATGPANQRGWKVAIIDDDVDVHNATVFALHHVDILHRPLTFIHAYSSQQAREVLAAEHDIAVILLDVVMETDQAGLELVSFIRQELGWQDTRIILRTGQPGYAPEEEVIREYDINDYKTKNELTRKKLLTSLTAAIRSYQQIRTIDASRSGLRQIIDSSASLTAEHGIHNFAAGVITQIAALCGVPPEGLLCAQGDCLEQPVSTPFSVIASAGRYQHLMNCPLDDIHNPAIRDTLKYVLTQRISVFKEHSMTLYFAGHDKRALAAYVDLPFPLSEINQELLAVFCSNLGVCLDNLRLVSQLSNHAYRDQLLRLPNRLKFIEQIDHAQSAMQAGQALVLLDIDDFAEINDILGHHFGDLLLQAVADRLQQQFGQAVVIARISGDAFGLLGPARLLTPEQLKSLFAAAFLFGESVHAITMSAGMVLLDGYSGNGADALKDASIALKRSKNQDRGSCTVFSREMGTEIRERANLMQNLHKAFSAEHLFLVYQPQISLCDGRLTGIEALLRWRNEEGKMIPPQEFIPLAEYSGLIVSLGEWVLRSACFLMARLQSRPNPPERIAVNVSAIQFRHADFLDNVRQALADSGLMADQLELEITESVSMTGSSLYEPRLRELKQIGVHIAIDDFGTGFSSLSYLDHLPVDRLKIDRTFVNQIDTAAGPRIAELIVQLGKKLDLCVIAEGIETPHHLEKLKEIGCHEGQGYLIGMPMTEAELVGWIAAYQPRP